ncbi:hypothetical protein Bbelb_274290 [Branchiostoma belcheri]|nr:hypothetical protein Bbelb_274290 [Branchiostoma belcheri]
MSFPRGIKCQVDLPTVPANFHSAGRPGRLSCQSSTGGSDLSNVPSLRPPAIFLMAEKRTVPGDQVSSLLQVTPNSRPGSNNRNHRQSRGPTCRGAVASKCNLSSGLRADRRVRNSSSLPPPVVSVRYLRQDRLIRASLCVSRSRVTDNKCRIHHYARTSANEFFSYVSYNSSPFSTTDRPLHCELYPPLRPMDNSSSLRHGVFEISLKDFVPYVTPQQLSLQRREDKPPAAPSAAGRYKLATF